jgi:hypothetical protein
MYPARHGGIELEALRTEVGLWVRTLEGGGGTPALPRIERNWG